MSTDLALRLEQAQVDFQQGLTRRAQGELPAARLHLLSAAEQLFLAAGQSHGRLRQTRTELAQKLLAEAEALKEMGSRTGPGSHAAVSTARPITIGEEQGETSWLVRELPQTRFDDIAGLQEVKEQIRLKLLYPFTHPELAARYAVQAGGGLLLYGPPGTGKTLIARAVAGEIQAAFFAIKPSEVMSQWVGVAEQNLRRLFAEAGEHPLSVVFIDEVEALAPKRRATQSTVMARVVPQLLAELDGFEQRSNPLLVIGATNEPWSIDTALLRPGRLDRLIYVAPPDMPARECILELNLRQVPLGEDVALGALAARTQNFSGADMAALAQRTRERVFSEAIQRGLARPIQQADFEAVLAEMHPSIPEKDLKLFEKFAQEGIK